MAGFLTFAIARSREELQSDKRNTQRAKLRDKRHDLVHNARDTHTGGAEQHREDLGACETREHCERLDTAKRENRLQWAKRGR
jgi:hypothetical protein